MESSRVLVLCFDPLTDAMPGPAIRSWNLAGQLARTHDVILAGTAGVSRTSPSMQLCAVTDGGGLDELVDWAGAVFAPTSVVRRHPVVAGSGKPLCIDMYIPTHLENLEALGESGGAEHVAAVEHQVSVLNDDLRHGDFFLCASDRQRDFWLGSLAALGRVNPATYAVDPSLRALIDVVPFGVDGSAPPQRSGQLRAEFPSIGPDDPVVIWGGGVYNWFDPTSLVRALDSLRARRPTIRLVFLGLRHPNPGIPEMSAVKQLREISDRLGLTGTHVFFNEGWVPYERRGAYLADADVAVSTHLDHVEAHFSFRTRILDYLWAGLPMVLTGGDTLSDGIASEGLAVAVPAGDPAAVAAAIDCLLDRPPSRDSVRAYGARFAWDKVAEPLLRWMDRPVRAPDRPPPVPAAPVGERPTPAAEGSVQRRAVLARARPLAHKLPEPVRRRVAALSRRWDL